MTGKENREQELMDEIEHLKDRLAQCVQSREDLEGADHTLIETRDRLSTILSAMSEHLVLQDQPPIMTP